MKKQILTLVIATCTLAVTANAQNNQSRKMTGGKADLNFQQQLAMVYKADLKLKKAFLAYQPEQIKTKVLPVKEALQNVDMKLLKGEAMKDWMKYHRVLESNLNQLAGAGNIKEQRVYFAQFNEALYKSIKAFGINGEKAFYDYCPMANGKGGYWLSDNKEIQNPYLADTMPGCGSVKTVIN